MMQPGGPGGMGGVHRAICHPCCPNLGRDQNWYKFANLSSRTRETRTWAILGYIPKMSTSTVYIAASDAAILQALQGLPSAAMGGGAIADTMMTRVGMVLKERIRDAFITKARGGTDEAGESWKPLSKNTIAYSRRHRYLEGNPQESRVFNRAKKKGWIPKSKQRAPYAPSFALTDKQNERWWQVFSKYLAIYKGNKGHAAAVAWIILKSEGAHTLMELYGDAKVEILMSTGILFNSFSPGLNGTGKVFAVGPGYVIVGTNAPWAAVHHKGSKNGRIPQRRLWPPVNKWPSSWWTDMLEQVWSGITDLAQEIIRKVSNQ